MARNLHNIPTRGQSPPPPSKAEVPRRLSISENVDWNILHKLIMLHNNVVQYYNIAYNEVHIYNTVDNYVYFEPTNTDEHWFTEIKFTNGIIIQFIEHGIIRKADMLRANEIWERLLAEADMEKQ